MARAVPRVPAKRDVHRALPPTQQLYALPFPASLPLPVCTDGLCLIGYPNSFLSVYVPPSPVFLLLPLTQHPPTSGRHNNRLNSRRLLRTIADNDNDNVYTSIFDVHPSNRDGDGDGDGFTPTCTPSALGSLSLRTPPVLPVIPVGGGTFAVDGVRGWEVG